MTSPTENRSVVVRLAMDPSAYVTGASRAAGATTALQREVSKVGAGAETSMSRAARASSTAETSMGRLNKSAATLGLTFGGLAGVGGAVAAALSVKWAGDFQSALTKLATTAGESQKNLGMVGRGMLDMAGQVGIGADELAKGMYTIDSAGVHGADSLTVLKAAAQGARQEQAELSHVVDAVTTSLHDYHLPASDAARVTSQLIAAVSNGKTTFDELTGAMHSVEPIAASAGMSIAQTAGALAAMTASGMHADQAAQNLASSIRSFEKPTGTMRDELYQLGIDAQDLSAHLGERGIAGTLQLVSDAIVSKMGPSGKVALEALNKNKAAAQDLVIMMKTMPPAVARMSSGLIDGSVSVAQYTKAAKALGGQQAAMALQFLGLYKSSAGFSSILKSGGPAVQTYIGALGKAVGTAEGLSVALQLTGENAKGTNKAIAAVGKAAGDTKGNIQGWDEVQHNFNQRLAETEAGAKSLAIEAGQHLLPILTDVLGYVHDHGPAALSALETGFHGAATAAGPLITAGGGVLHVFQELPGPVKEAVVALAALKIATSINFLGIASGFGRVTAGVRGLSAAMSEEVAMQRWAATLGGITGAAPAAEAGLSRMAVAGGLATRAMGGLRSAGSSVVSMFGGPWGVALVGAAVGVGVLVSAIQSHQKEVQADTEAVKSWYQAMATEGGGAAVSGMNSIRSKTLELAKAKADLDKLGHSAPAYSFGQSGLDAANAQSGAIAAARQHVKDLSDELTKGKKEWDDYWNSLSPQGQAAATVAADEANLAYAIQTTGVASIATKNATNDYNAAKAKQKTLTDQVSAAEQTQIDKTNALASAQLGAVSSSLAASQAQSQLDDAIAQYLKDSTDGQHSTKQLADESRDLAQQAIAAAEAAGKQAADQAKANGVTDDGTIANKAILDSLRESAAHMAGPGHDALVKAYNDLVRTTIGSGTLADTVKKVGGTWANTWDANVKVLHGATDQQIQDLNALGYKVTHLPNGDVVVNGDTHLARRSLDALINDYANKVVRIDTAAGQHISSATGSGGTSTRYAGGGQLHGPGTGTSDSIPIMASNKEFIVNAAATEANLPLLYAINSGAIRGFARGGQVFDMYKTMPADLSTAAVAQARAQIAAMVPTFSGGGAGDPAIRALGMQIAAQMGVGSQFPAIDFVFSHESGWNPAAQNPTSSAYGIPQFLDSTWALYGGRTPYAGQQIHHGIEYMDDRYGSPNAAASFWAAHHWYHDGGTVRGPAGANVPAVLKVGETVRTVEQETALQNPVLRSRELVGAGAGGSGMTVHRTDARSYSFTNMGGQPVSERAFREMLREQEFLHP